jgi:hypothetical protein
VPRAALVEQLVPDQLDRGRPHRHAIVARYTSPLPPRPSRGADLARLTTTSIGSDAPAEPAVRACDLAHLCEQNGISM